MRIARALVVFVALAIPSGAVADTSSAAKYQDCYGAVQALKRGDCRRAVDNLNAFLREHSYVREWLSTNVMRKSTFAASKASRGGLSLYLIIHHWTTRIELVIV